MTPERPVRSRGIGHAPGNRLHAGVEDRELDGCRLLGHGPAHTRLRSITRPPARLETAEQSGGSTTVIKGDSTIAGPASGARKAEKVAYGGLEPAVTRKIREPLRRLALLAKVEGRRNSVVCVDPALNTSAPGEELDDGRWIGHRKQFVVGLAEAGDERLDCCCVEAGILWERDFDVPSLSEMARFD
jgi:hypothetical protein